MRPRPHLSKAPITEALIDVQVKLPTTVDLPRLASFQESIREQYPNRKERVTWRGGFRVQKDGQSPAIEQPSGGPDGYIYSSPDNRQFVQARLDGFTFNRRAPYDRWETFRAEAMKHWGLYSAVTTPVAITRAAVRYINRIDIPYPGIEFKDYVRTVPEVAPTLPQGLANFFMRVVLPHPTRNCVAIVTETIESPNEKENVLPLILDIDVYQVMAEKPDDKTLWETIERLKSFEDEVFFETITDKVVALYT